MDDKQSLNELALFAGAGGGILGGHLLGWRCVCAVERDPYAAGVLLARQNDGCLLPFPVWDDVCTFDGKPWQGIVDVVSGGFPCQDISAAGKGAGIDGERSGLWREMARIIGEVGPRFVLVENSPVLTSRGLGTVLGDLASLGYDARWGVLGAIHAGGPHKRERIWIVADSYRSRCEKFDLSTKPKEARQHSWFFDSSHLADAENAQPIGRRNWAGRRQWSPRDDDGARAEGTLWWESEPNMGRVAHGVAARVDRLRCLGNGQVPAVVRLAWETLTSTEIPY